MKKLFLAITLFTSITLAQLSEETPLQQFKRGQLTAKILNKDILEKISAEKSWLINGEIRPQEMDADEAVANGHIVCAFFIPSTVLKSDEYSLYYSEHYDMNADHLQFSSSENKFFGISCFKKEGQSDLTLKEMNQAFLNLVDYTINQ